MVAIPIQTPNNTTYANVEQIEPGLFLARAQSDTRLQAYGRTEAESLAKLSMRIESAADCAA